MKTSHYYQVRIKNELDKRIKSNPRYSLRAFAKSFGMDPSALSRILNGQKLLTPSLAEKILSRLELSPRDSKKFLLSMAHAYDEEGAQRKNPAVKALLKNPKPKMERDLTPDIFKIISDWYHYAILSLTTEENFVYDNRWIAKELGIQEIEAKLAIERMIELDLLEVSGNTIKRTKNRLTTGDLTVTTSALRRRIKQVSEKSVHSLENDPITERNHTTMTMAIDPEQIGVAKDMIQDFMDKLSEVLQTKKKTVYELQINLFPLQRKTK